MGGHQSGKKSTPESVTYVTPKELFEPLGPFDLDPCTPPIMPWDTAAIRFTEVEDGLKQDWFGDVWLNPPWGSGNIDPWLEKMAAYNRGMVLQPARTETGYFQEWVWNRARGLYFLFYRPHFYNIHGVRYKANCGCPVVYASYGKDADERIRLFKERGRYVPLIEETQVPSGYNGSWFSIVSMGIRQYGNELQLIYSMVERIAADKCKANKHYREKIRQQVYRYHAKVLKTEFSESV